QTGAIAELPKVGQQREIPQRAREEGTVVAAQAIEMAVEQKATLEEQVYNSVEPRPSNIKRGAPVAQAPSIGGLLYAQHIGSGYQLVNSTPEIVLKLEETSMENIFLTQYGGNNAMVFKKDDKWFLEYVENGEKMNKELQIKF